MHILLGAVVGALIGVAAAVVVAKLTGQPITTKGLVAAGIGGAVAGAVTAATFGAGGAAAATTARAVTAFVVGGAAGGGSERVVSNVEDGRAITDGVTGATLTGAATGLVLYGAGRALSPLVKAAAVGTGLARIFRGAEGGAESAEGKVARAVEPAKPKFDPATYEYKIPPPARVGDVIEIDPRQLASRQYFVEGGFDGKPLGSYSEAPSAEYGGNPSIPDVYWVDRPVEMLDKSMREGFWAIKDGNHRVADAIVRGLPTVKARVQFYPVELDASYDPNANFLARPLERVYTPAEQIPVWQGDDRMLGTVGEIAAKQAARRAAAAAVTDPPRTGITQALDSSMGETPSGGTGGH